MTQRLQGILFDFGDTLIDFGKVDVLARFEDGAKAAYAYLDELGQPMPEFERYHRQQLRAVKRSYFISHLTSQDFNALDLIDHLGESLGHDLTKEQLEELAWRWYEPVSQCGSVEPGLREAVETIRDQGLTIGIISNTFIPDTVLDRHLENVGLIDLFPMRIYSCTQDFRKPDRRIFQLALDNLGLAAEESLYIGDSVRNDIFGANRMGMVSVLKDISGKKRPWLRKNRPDHTVRSITELPGVIAQYNG
jgi:HAD superfamily hydrolase (TIGR01549 family)